MLGAHTLKDIYQSVSSRLPRKVVVTKKEPRPEIGLMTTFNMNRPVRNQTVHVEETRNSKLVGILFSHPATNLAQNEIIDHLPHFHLRSGEAVDFFCVGYGAYWPPEHFADQKPVVKIDGVDWLFSEQAFSDVIGSYPETAIFQLMVNKKFSLRPELHASNSGLEKVCAIEV